MQSQYVIEKMNSEIKILRLDPQKKDYSKDIFRLYLFENWSCEDDDSSEIQIALQNSYCAYGAFDRQKMVGFFRALSDGVSDAYLLDLIVEPSYRNRGIASELVRSILSELKSKNLSWITCISNPKVDKLYKKFGSEMQSFTPFRF